MLGHDFRHRSLISKLIWIPPHVRGNGTHVKGYWRKGNPAGVLKQQLDAAEKKGKPVKVKSAKEALRRLEKGERVEMDPDEVGVFLDKLAKIGQDAYEKGVDAPNYNLCDVTVGDRSIFCEGNKGIKRVHMPQLKGKRIKPGSEADKLERDKEGEVDLTPGFRKALTDLGVKISGPEQRPADTLKATQSELVGAQVASMMASAEAGKFDPSSKPIFISRDGYILDGHHRWAATAGRKFHKGERLMQTVEVIDLPIADLIPMVTSYTEGMGVMPKAGKTGADKPLAKADFRYGWMLEPPCIECS